MWVCVRARVGGGFSSQLTSGCLLSVHKSLAPASTLDVDSRLRQCVQAPACVQGRQLMMMPAGCGQPLQQPSNVEQQQDWTNSGKLALRLINLILTTWWRPDRKLNPRPLDRKSTGAKIPVYRCCWKDEVSCRNWPLMPVPLTHLTHHHQV